MRIGILAGTALVALGGCSGDTPEAGNNAADTNAANAAEPMNEAASAEAQAALNELVPPYPGAQQVQTGGTVGPGVGGSVTFRTPDPAAQVVDFYVGGAERSGFTVEDRTDLNGMAVSMTARRGASDLITVSANRVGDITQVQIMAAAAAR